jgi:hypothetical protein
MSDVNLSNSNNTYSTQIKSFKRNRFWCDFQYLDELPDSHATLFAHRNVLDFNAEIKISQPQNNAYALRANRWRDNEISRKNICRFLQDKKVKEVEALIFGWIGSDGEIPDPIKFLIDNYNLLKSLKAIFLGDIKDQDYMISELLQGDIYPVLEIYQELEILHIRGSCIRFTKSCKCPSLRALRIESGGLGQEAILDLNNLELPNLEYLELWLGRKEYGGNSSVTDLMPIISGSKFPKLKYLGLRNCEYTDDIAYALSESLIMDQLIELDLSMGTLGDEAFSSLLYSPYVNKIDFMNVSQSFISNSFLKEELPSFHLGFEVNVNNQRLAEYQDEIIDKDHRYCVVAE